MPTPVVLTLGGVELSGALLDAEPAATLADLLPVSLRMTRWGDEYFGPLLPPLGEHPGPRREEMAVGDLAWWEPGEAFCLFFGKTPASHGEEPRAASPVLLLGNVSGDWDAVRRLGREVTATLDLAEGP